MKNTITICECFARDGLQHEKLFVPTGAKVSLIDRFTDIGFRRIEATSYSNPDKVPAFRDASDVLSGIRRGAGVHYKATCANLRSVTRALADLDAGYGATELSLLVSASESHSLRNLRADRATQWRNVAEMAKAAAGRFRLVGVISVAFGCPFEGRIDMTRVVEDAARFADIGAELLTVGDTTGFATPNLVRRLFTRLRAEVPQIVPVGHFHDTRGLGLANCMAAIESGCRLLDSAMGGVGGHPAQIQYGGGITGNVATEDLANMLEEEGLSTGLDLDALIEASRVSEQILGRELESRVARSGFGLAGLGRHV